jgi:hypothetical protein
VKALKDAGLIEKKLISFFLSHKHQSEFMFGGYQEELLNTDINNHSTEELGIKWLPLTSRNYWQVRLEDIQIGEKSIYSKTYDHAILDSGTSLITIPTVEFNAFILAFANNYLNFGFKC